MNVLELEDSSIHLCKGKNKEFNLPLGALSWIMLETLKAASSLRPPNSFGIIVLGLQLLAGVIGVKKL